MSKQVRFRRGTTAQHATFTGALGEVTVDTDKNVTVVHDGSTAGGVPTAREDRPRGWTRTEYFTTVGATTWTLTGKTDLRRIVVTAYGGGGGGSSAQAGGGGGAGGVGVRTIELADLTTNITVTVGAGGAIGNAGGTTTFGTYLTATGGSAGGAPTAGAGGTASGTAVLILGGQGGAAGASHSVPIFNNGAYTYFPAQSNAGIGNRGGGIGAGVLGGNARGITGSGGGKSGTGSNGSVIVEEIYGLV
jgi:hypothetical protein